MRMITFSFLFFFLFWVLIYFLHFSLRIQSLTTQDTETLKNNSYTFLISVRFPSLQNSDTILVRWLMISVLTDLPISSTFRWANLRSPASSTDTGKRGFKRERVGVGNKIIDLLINNQNLIHHFLSDRVFSFSQKSDSSGHFAHFCASYP